MKRFILLPVTALALMSCQANAATTTIKVPKAAVVAAFNTALQGTQIVLDNYGKKKGTSWLSQQSYILLPNGKKISFSIPESTIKVTKKRRWKHYINDLRSQSIQVTAPGNTLSFDIAFESQGEEIKGKCLRKGKECKLKMERDIHLNNALFAISAVPTALDGSISYRSPKASFKADLKIPNRLCKTFKKLCGKIENAIYKKLQARINGELKKALGRADVRKKVAAAVRKTLNGKLTGLLKARLGGYAPPQWSIIKVTPKGSNYEIVIKHPDVIGAGSVTIKGFKIKKASARMTCPGNIDYQATIATTGKVSGKVWIEYTLPGAAYKKGPVRAWKMNKAGTATSLLSHPWKGKPKKWQGGTARLVVQWKGSNGKTYTIRSKPVKFKRYCQLGITNKIKF